MSIQHKVLQTTPLLAILAWLLLSLGQTSTAEARGGGSDQSLIFEDFEGSLDPGLQLEGLPAPFVTPEKPIAGNLSLKVPCPVYSQGSDAPETIIRPLSANQLDMSWWGWIQDLCPNGDNELTMARMSVDESGDDLVGFVSVRSAGDDCEIAASIVNDAGVTQSSGWHVLDPTAMASGPLIFKTSWRAASSANLADGQLRLEVQRPNQSPLLTIGLAGADNDSHLINRAGIGIINVVTIEDCTEHLEVDNIQVAW